MRHLKYLLTITFLTVTLSALAQQPFTAGNIVVLRVGAGTATITSSATAVFLDEYTPNGVLVQSIAMPTAASGGNNILTIRGTQSREGMINLSTDGRYLVVAGINTAPLTGSSSTASVIGLVNYNGNINTSTAITDMTENSNIPRSAISDDGSHLWFGGSSAIRYATAGSSSSVLLTNPGSGFTDLNIANGQLYVSTQVGIDPGIFVVGTGLPTTTGQTLTNLPGMPGGFPISNQGQFAFADLDPGVPG